MRSKGSPYLVGLREIPSGVEGLHRAFNLSGDFARGALADTEATAETARLGADVTLFKSGEEVLARGNVTGELTMVCSRCAGNAKVTIDAPYQVLYLPRDADAPEPGGDDDVTEQPDVIGYDDDEIDLGEMLREEVLLALPYAPLCSEVCKGLCANCGKDLNDGPCQCDAVSAEDGQLRDERLAALRNLKLQS